MVEDEPWPITATAIPGLREPFSALSHLLAAVAAAVLGSFLIARTRGAWARSAAIVFVVSTVFLLSMSGVYHMLDLGTGRSVLKRLDAAGVYILIAGTVTPPVLILLRGRQRLVFLIAAWAMAATFVPLRVIFFSYTEGIVGGLGPLFMGWMGATLAWVLAKRWGWKAMLPLVYGGLAYTVGVALVPFTELVLIPGVIGVHELWHVAVLVGLGFHWSFIDRIASLRPEDVAEAEDWAALMVVANGRRPEWRGRVVLGAPIRWIRRRSDRA